MSVCGVLANVIMEHENQSSSGAFSKLHVEDNRKKKEPPFIALLLMAFLLVFTIAGVLKTLYWIVFVWDVS